MATLEARAKNARQSLFQRYDQLNALWEKAEEQITKFHIPRPVCYEYEALCAFQYGEEEPYEGCCLGVQKVKGKWRICHGTYYYCAPPGDDEPDWKPIIECSAEVRASAVEHLEGLREKVVESAEKFVPVVEEAIEKLRRFVKDDVKELLAERAKLNGRAK